LEKGEIITITIGMGADQDKDKPGVYATHSGNKLLFLTNVEFVNRLKEIELRDRSAVLYTQIDMVEMLKANAALNPVGQLMFASPFFTGVVHDLNPAEVTNVRVAVRTPFELRKFAFKRIAKNEVAKTPEKEKEKAKDDKAKEKEKAKDTAAEWKWIDAAGIDEFHVDSDKVASFVKEFARLHTDRFVAFAGGPREEQKLDPKDALIKLELDMKDGRTVTLLVGANYQSFGHYAASSLWQGNDGKTSTVFFIPRPVVEPILRGASYFAKDRTAAN
jgi:hypothetical protein